MRKVVAILTVVLALSGVGGTTYAAQDSLPGDALYSAKLSVEGLTMMLQGEDVSRAERALIFADKRVREMVALIVEGCPEDVDLAVGKYCYTLNMTLAGMEEALRKGGSIAGDMVSLVANTMAQHLSILDGLYDIVPDEAKPAIERAMVEALKCHQRAIQVGEELGPQVSELATTPPR